MDIHYWKELLSTQIDVLLKDKISLQPKWLELEVKGGLESFQFSDKVFPQFYFKSRGEDYQFLLFGEARSFAVKDVQSDWMSDFENFKKKLPQNCLIYLRADFDIDNKKESNFSKSKGTSRTFLSASPWAGFPSVQFSVPKIALFKKNDKLTLCIFVDENVQDLTDLLIDCLNLNSTDIFSMPKAINRKDNPSKEGWLKNVSDVINEIKTTSLEKVVLARKVELLLDEAIHLSKWRELLKKNEENSYTVYFRSNKDKCFFTLSPERLIKFSKCNLETEALAGTYPRGDSIAEDVKIEKELMTSNKDRLEHQYVIDFLKETISPYLLGEIKESKTDVLKLNQVQHLKTNLRGQLKSIDEALKLVFDLHPTPAVCGVPTIDAKKIIQQKENFERGWYTGVFGWIKGDESEFIVNIRACLINDRRLSIFSGAGIVADSNPETEWKEIEQKTKIYLNYFSENF